MADLIDRTGAPFNMALATLEKVNNILKQIANVSVLFISDDQGSSELSPGKAQHMKYRLVKQLFIQSVPLFDTKKYEAFMHDILKDIRSIKLKYGNRYQNNRIIGKFEVFDQSVEDELDNITMDVQAELQKEGYFMPPKSDPRFSWKQS